MLDRVQVNVIAQAVPIAFIPNAMPRGLRRAIARPTSLAAEYDRSGRGGAMRHLSCFFKDPIGVEDPNLFAQWEMLVSHVQSEVRARAVGSVQ